MYILRQSIVNVFKTFLTSFLCSTVFAFLIYTETALPNAFICLVLNGTAFLLFIYLFFLSLFKLFNNSFSLAEYYVPATVSVVSYIAVTSYLYSTRYMFYMWLFMPTRVLEPWLNSSTAFLSVIATYVVMIAAVVLVPRINVMGD